MNRHAESAQIESEDVDAVSVFITGDKDNSARNANIDDLTVFASTDKPTGSGRIKIQVAWRGGRGEGQGGEGCRTYGLWASAHDGTFWLVGPRRLAK